MKLLTSPWILALIGAVLNLGLTAKLVLPEILAAGEGRVIVPEKTAAPPRLWSFKTEAIDQLIEELHAERAKSALAEKDLVTLQSHLEAERAELEKVRSDILTMRAEIEQRVVEISEGEYKNLKSLAQTYAAMNPPAVVAIFREMDDNMSVKILSLMKADRTGPILGEMAKTADRPGEEPMAKRAANITDKLRLLKPVKKENS